MLSLTKYFKLLTARQRFQVKINNNNTYNHRAQTLSSEVTQRLIRAGVRLPCGQKQEAVGKAERQRQRLR